MIRQCAWCQRQIGQVPPLEDLSITHTVCEPCGQELLNDLVSMDDFVRESQEPCATTEPDP